MPVNPLLHGDIIFNAKPDAVPYNYRISYKVSQICLIMRICSFQGSCSLIKLHMISAALCTRNNMDKLLKFANEELSNSPIVRFDPSVNKALTFSVAYGFIMQQKSGNYKLTDKGRNLTDQIQAVDDLMISEKIDLSRLSKKLSEKKIQELTEIWRFNNAED
ncbi:hypothetical protein E4665_17200 [Sporolactobacillus shoreae]|uniref:Uncharacterized protein n=1 Tax=Sporolactobacillus shoreae TaxID=1465501 RepID=A0A4Z0GIY2_9BACL|nr:hypothetical protein [Sporolactobacillus shoreae]TGA95894.1 hypothetical protein E4665_17200 [Sporolactobacillus shoreae]